MFDLNSLLTLSALALAGYYAVGAIKLKESAHRAVENHCRQVGVQLLDGTIFLRRLGLARDARGHFSLKREFQFEFTATGEDRNRGCIRLQGRRIAAIELAPHRFH